MWPGGRVVRACVMAHGRIGTMCSGMSCRMMSSQARRMLFFGSDCFAVESLKQLSHNREGLVETLEVVTLSRDVPVKRFALENNLPLHPWPVGDITGQFDVGVVVSFGCLLPHSLIDKFPFGVLNVHPSLLPRWRGPAPILHTILHGDRVTGVSIMQIRPHRFDVGPIISQERYPVPPGCTTEELGAVLATKGAHLLIDSLRTLPERLANKREQTDTHATFAPKINDALRWVVWEEQSCDQIDCLYRAIGAKSPLTTMWMGKTIKLLDFVGECDISLSDETRNAIPGYMICLNDSGTLAVRCKDGWVGFKTVIVNKKIKATDFYNGYLNPTLQRKTLHPHHVLRRFVKRKDHHHHHHPPDRGAAKVPQQ